MREKKDEFLRMLGGQKGVKERYEEIIKLYGKKITPSNAARLAGRIMFLAKLDNEENLKKQIDKGFLIEEIRTENIGVEIPMRAGGSRKLFQKKD